MNIQVSLILVQSFDPQLYDQLEKVVDNIISSQTMVIITSSNLEDTIIALDIINQYPDIFHTTVGYHPHNAKDLNLSTLI